jgi:ATP/maltotriose-dependent transcriptional regulator MalT
VADEDRKHCGDEERRKLHIRRFVEVPNETFSQGREAVGQEALAVRISDTLMRARLNDRLSSAAKHPITLIVAPAGFGKSVALRDYLLNARSDAIRFDVRREDGSLLAFARRFAEALKPIVPAAAASFNALQERVLAAGDRARLVSDWFAEHLKRTIAGIVVDDLHFAAADPDSIAFLSELVDKTADRIDWILATRSDAGLPIATWIAYGRMDLPITQDDLRFTLEEAVAAAQAGQPGAHPAEVEALWHSTEGWPVALAIALRTQTQAADLRAAVTRELIYRYLAEQVFVRVTESQRDFLLTTSIFSAFDVAMAQALGGTAEFIAELRHGVAFLTEIEPGQYRYHDLFREYLENELARRGETARQRALALGARLLEERDDLPGSLVLYAKAKDPASILRAIESQGFALFERGEADALTTALEAIPDELRRDSPAALGLQAALEAARGHFEPASRGFVAAIDRAKSQELRLLLVHRYAIELVRHGGDGVGLLEAHCSDASVSAALRVPLLGTLATAYARAGRPADALATIAQALELIDPVAGDDVRARIYHQAAHVYNECGMNEAARGYASLAVDLALARNLYDVAVRAYSVLYTIAYDNGDDPIACLTILDRLLDCARKAASSQGLLYGLMASYGIEADRGNDAALSHIERQLAEVPDTLPQNRSEVLLPSMALRAAWSGDFRRAVELLERAGDSQNDERRAEHFSELALYACSAGMRESAENAAEEAASALCRCEKPTPRALRSRLMLAFFELTRGRIASARRLLSAVKAELEPSMSRLEALADAGTALCRSIDGGGDAASLAGALERLRAEQFGGIARLLEAIPFPSSTAGGYATLSATEREILQELVAGGSTRDLAARTSRSPRTIDAHIRSICKKLSCRSRRDAVALAIGSGWVQNV